MPFLILANPRPDRPHAKHSKRDRCAGRLERGQSQTFREAWRPRGFGRMHRPDARQRLDGVVTKAESLRDESCAAAWLWRDDDSHGAGGMRPSRCFAWCAAETWETSLLGSGLGGRDPLIFLPSTSETVPVVSGFAVRRYRNSVRGTTIRGPPPRSSVTPESDGPGGR